MKMWSGRINQPLDPEFERWQRSFDFDRRLLAYECAASRAHARALGKAGVVSADEVRAMVDGLEKIERRCATDPAAFDQSDAEDVHHFVELQLTSLIGDAGLRLHTGRSRNEQIATDLRLFTRDAIDQISAHAVELLDVLLARARELGDAVMPSYTHLQRAEPVLAAHWLLAYFEMLMRDHQRLADCRTRVNLLPLGSGPVAGTHFPLDREQMARELGFDGITHNSMDAVSDRDFAVEFLNALALIAAHFSRLAEDFVLYSTTEFGFVLLPDAFATGSSAMPQKKNPDLFELLRGKTGAVIASAIAVLTTVKGLPLSYNRDLQETQQPLFTAADTISGSLRVLTGFLRAVQFDTARMQSAAATGFLNATAAANYLVARGMPFRKAHAVAGELVRKCLDRGCELADLDVAELQQASPLFDAGAKGALELSNVVAGHDVVGGTSPARVRAALDAASERLRSLQAAAQEEISAYA